MASYLYSERGWRRQRRLNSLIEPQVSTITKQAALSRTEATVGYAKATIAAGAAGAFFLATGPQPLSKGTAERSGVVNLCDSALEVDDKVSIQWYAVTATEGFFGAVKCSAESSNSGCNICKLIDAIELLHPNMEENIKELIEELKADCGCQVCGCSVPAEISMTVDGLSNSVDNDLTTFPPTVSTVRWSDLNGVTFRWIRSGCSLVLDEASLEHEVSISITGLQAPAPLKADADGSRYDTPPPVGNADPQWSTSQLWFSTIDAYAIRHNPGQGQGPASNLLFDCEAIRGSFPVEISARATAVPRLGHMIVTGTATIV